jgi:hypothetical protein
VIRAERPLTEIDSSEENLIVPSLQDIFNLLVTMLGGYLILAEGAERA